MLFVLLALVGLAACDEPEVRINYTIAIQKGEDATVHCYSSILTTAFNETNTTCNNTLPYCQTQFEKFSCCVKVRWEETPKRLTCGVPGLNVVNNTLYISVNVVKKYGLELEPRNKTTETYEKDWDCIEQLNKTRISEGHLVSVGWTLSKPEPGYDMLDIYEKQYTPPKYKDVSIVTRQPVYRWKVGQSFTCNGTNYRVMEGYGCLEISPNKWPAFANCSVIQKVGIIVGVICNFIFTYAILCLMAKGCQRLKGCTKTYEDD